MDGVNGRAWRRTFEWLVAIISKSEADDEKSSRLWVSCSSVCGSKGWIFIDFPSGGWYNSRMNQKNFTFKAGESSGEVSALLLRPENARALLVFAHGAGAGMRYDFMESMAIDLGHVNIATLRYNFPYMEHGRKSPDPQPILLETIQSAVAAAREAAPDLPLIAGGKSLGGRMTSMALLPPHVLGIVFFGFPLHAPGKHSTERATHLSDVSLPMLFLQGTRDTFTELDLLHPIITKLGEKATMHIVEGADHSFHMLKSSGLTDGEVLKQLAQTTADWLSGLL